MITQKIPVTVLTGFLGSGKTTLLNHILTSQHGKRIAVIENEFGEIGIDNELVINAEEEIFEMNNGCICCTVRGDLIRILAQLMRRKDKFDYILLETTGLANPAPVAQTFFADEEMREMFELDGIVTVVDAKHVWQHLDTEDECKQQIAFADVILINKTDLVEAQIIRQLQERIKGINPQARIYETQNAVLDVDKLLNIRAFDLDNRTLLNPDFLEEELPFETLAVYKLSAGTYCIEFGESHHDHSPHHDHEHSHHHHDHDNIRLAILPITSSKEEAIQKVKRSAIMLFATACHTSTHDLIPSESLLYEVDTCGHAHYHLQISTEGFYALITEYGTDEIGLRLQKDNKTVKPSQIHYFEHTHSHDEEVYSVGIQTQKPLDEQKLNLWLGNLLQTQGQNIFRMKGILNLRNEPQRVVFQGVHMMFDAKPTTAWESDEVRQSQMIFIGRKLDKEALRQGFLACTQ